MILRQLGLGVQELEAGPLTILLSHSIPVAYRDMRPEAMPPGLYRTGERFSKATTAHINKWVNKRPCSVIPHALVVAAFQSISRFPVRHGETQTEAEAAPSLA